MTKFQKCVTKLAYNASMASIQERKNSKGRTTSYRVRWREQGRHGPQEFTSFETLAQAEMFKKILELNDHNSAKAERQILAAASSTPTIVEVAHIHMQRLSDIAVHTRHTYERMIVNHLSDELGQLPADMLSEEDIAAWVMRMRDKGRSPKTISNVHGFLSSVVKTAIYRGYRPDNPCDHTRLPKSDHTEDKTTFLTKEELRLILSHLDRHFHPLILFLVGTGLRFSEAAALQPSDFSDDGGKYSVRVTKAWKRDDKNGRTIGPPKTPRARRTIELDRDLAFTVAPLVASTPLDGYVFRMKHDGELTTQALHNKAWRPALTAARKAGLRKAPRIHDLRHTYASWSLAGAPGVEPLSTFDLSRLMGHESVDTTTKVYSHLMPEAMRKGAQIIGTQMSGLYNVAPAEKPRQIGAVSAD